jgi:hypothetical protein
MSAEQCRRAVGAALTAWVIEEIREADGRGGKVAAMTRARILAGGLDKLAETINRFKEPPRDFAPLAIALAEAAREANTSANGHGARVRGSY